MGYLWDLSVPFCTPLIRLNDSVSVSNNLLTLLIRVGLSCTVSEKN